MTFFLVHWPAFLVGVIVLVMLWPLGRRFLRRLIPDYQPHGSLHYLLGLEYWQHNAHTIRVHVVWGMLVWSIPFRAKWYGVRTP